MQVYQASKSGADCEPGPGFLTGQPKYGLDENRVLAVFCAVLLVGLTGAAAVPGNGNGDWEEGDGFQWRPLSVSTGGSVGFSEVPPDRTGILFTNRLAVAHSITNQILLNGSGVAAGDVDGDGRCDLYFCGLDEPNALYRGLGEWRFEDATAVAGVACADQASMGAALADIDGDKDLDLLVTGLARGVRLFVNDGQGRFTEDTESAGLRGNSAGTTLSLADIDGDGDLDLYLGNYRSVTLRDEPSPRFAVSTANNQFELVAVNGRSVSSPELRGRFSVDRRFGVLEHGEADILYRNEGNGRFVAVDWTDGTFLGADGQAVAVPYDWTLSAMFHDINGDGAPDLYVCADFQSEDRIWINQGQGGFRALDALAMRHSSLFSMGVDFADIDRDGHDDFFVADMLSRQHALRQVQLGYFNPFLLSVGQVDSRPQYSRNMLFWNRDEGAYAEIAQFSGVEASDWCWCPVFLDVDLDGYEDLLLVTGHERDAQNVDVARQIDVLKQTKRMPHLEQLNLRRMFPRLATPNFAFRNDGQLRFTETGAAWGFDSPRVSQGICVADLDEDGDQDVVINCLNDGPLAYRNNSSAPRVAVRLRGRAPNTRGVGARIRVVQEGRPGQSQEVIAGGRYLSSDAPSRTFAAHASTPLTVEVTWRSGRRSSVRQAAPNRLYLIGEPPENPSEPAPSPKTPTLFDDVSHLLAHRHQDEPFNDFERQPLLPRTLSTLGPGVSWCDLDGDGRDDLLIGGGRGGTLKGWRNDPMTGLTPLAGEPFDAALAREQTTVLGWTLPGKGIVLTWGAATYEDTGTNASAVQSYDLQRKAWMEPLIWETGTSVGPLVAADVEGDGDLDLFVGGRVVPGRYPEAADSLLLVNEDGRLRPDPRAVDALREVGLVSSAVWSDLDGDGLPELVLAIEWGPIRILRWGQNGFAEITDALGFGKLTGWWNSVAAGDFDGDGRMDLVAGNWGRNTRYESVLPDQIRLYYGDLAGEPFLEVIDAYTAPELGKVVPWRDWETLARSIPSLRERYRSFTDFSAVGMEELLEPYRDHRVLSVNTLDSMVFLNRGDRFEGRPLPLVAQLSPVFGLGVADFNGDGRKDLVLSRNFFGVSADATRLDAGGTLLLRGDGQGGFKAVNSTVSGLRSYGEGRGAAVCDYDQDGRVDVVIGQHAGTTRLFRNTTGRPGLRVRVLGLPGNPTAVGAVLRPVYAGSESGGNESRGPAWEIHAGGGYWSQDSAVAVLGAPAKIRAIDVRWPGGREERVQVSPGVQELVIRSATP